MAAVAFGVSSAKIANPGRTSRKDGGNRAVKASPSAVSLVRESSFRCDGIKAAQRNGLAIGATAKRAVPRAAVLSDDSIITGKAFRGREREEEEEEEEKDYRYLERRAMVHSFLFSSPRADSGSRNVLKIGINGFGRIGRLVFRIAMQREDIQVVAVNDPFVSPDYMAYMLKYDSVHGRFGGSIEYTENSLTVDGMEVKCFGERDPASIPWGDAGVEVVAEATGVFKELDTAQAHIDAGAQKVIITAPSKTGAT